MMELIMELPPNASKLVLTNGVNIIKKQIMFRFFKLHAFIEELLENNKTLQRPISNISRRISI